MASFPPLPVNDPIAEVREKTDENGKQEISASGEPDLGQGRLNFSWTQWFNSITLALGLAPTRIGSASLSLQAASIGATDLGGATASAGLYQIQYYLRITTPATASSSVQIQFAWTDEGVGQTATGSAVTGNTTTSYDQGTLIFYSDASSPITYAISYASVGATPAQYKLLVALSAVQL